MTKSDGKVNVDEGETLTFTILFTNVNAAALTLSNVVITDTFRPLPPYASPVGVAGDWSQLATNVYTHFVGDLDPGESGSFQFSLQLSDTIPASVRVISNTVEIGHGSDELAFETDTDNNRSTDVDILNGPDLIVAGLEISPANPRAGLPITFAVTVRNQGGVDTENAAGGQFVVELYLKGSGATPAGPPVDVFDHVGGYWSDETGSQERPAYACLSASLNAGSEEICTFVITDVTEADDYDVYVQADASFEDWDGESWGDEYGMVYEALESNNVYTYGVIQVQGHNIYLPLIVRSH